jgi:chromosome segregation ATPase
MTLDDRSLNSDRNPDAVANRGFWAGIALDRLERIGELQAKLNAAVLAREQAERERDEARAEVTLLKSVVAELDAGEVDRPELEKENERLHVTIDALTEKLNTKVDEITRLQVAIREHRDQKGDNRCWLDDFNLYKVLPEGPSYDSSLPPKCEFLESCSRFWEQRQLPDAMSRRADEMTITQLQAEVERLRTELKRPREPEPVDSATVDAWKEKLDQTPLRPVSLGPTYTWPVDHSAVQESQPAPNILTILDDRISAVDRRVDVVREDLLKLGDQAETVAQLQAEVAAIHTEVATIRDEPEPPLPSPEQLQRVIHDQRVDLMTRRIDDVVQHVEEMAGQVTRLSSRFNLLNQGISSPVRVTELIPLPSNAGDYEADPNILNARVNLLQEKLAALELQLSSVLGKSKLASKAAFADYTHFQSQLDETRLQVQETAKTIAFYWGNPLGPAALDAIRDEVKVVAESINSIRNQCGAMGVIQADFANRLADLEAPNPVLETVASEIRELKGQFESLLEGTRISFEQHGQRLTRLEEQKVTWDETKRALGMLPLISEQGSRNANRIEQLAINLARRIENLKRRTRDIAAKLRKPVLAPASGTEPAKPNGEPVEAASPAIPKPVGKVKTGKVKAWNKTTKPK